MPYPRHVAVLRTIRATLLSKAVPSPGRYSIWTGLAMLYVVWLIAPASDTDWAVPFVVFALAITGVWSIERGFRLERQRRRRH
jgi:O-antigen/teichoic acid export membrane protein